MNAAALSARDAAASAIEVLLNMSILLLRPRRRGGDAAAIRQPNAALSRSFLIQVSQPLNSRSDMSRLQLSQ